MSGHALLAEQFDSLLTNKSQEEGQPLHHISSASCLHPTGTYSFDEGQRGLMQHVEQSPNIHALCSATHQKVTHTVQVCRVKLF